MNLARAAGRLDPASMRPRFMNRGSDYVERATEREQIGLQ